jgi:hypothetical protein
MKEYDINITQVEEYQTIKNIADLEQILARAQSTIVQGGVVNLIRENPDGSSYKFEEITKEDDLRSYKESVMKYL